VKPAASSRAIIVGNKPINELSVMSEAVIKGELMLEA
jgi:hypothetical protein